jgi:hypothetical protein
MRHVSCFLRNGDRVFLTYSMTGRGTEAASGSVALPDMTPYGRGEAWQTSPDGWPGGYYPCRYWRSDRPGTPPGSGQLPQVAADPPGATPAEALGRNGHHH